LREFEEGAEMTKTEIREKAKDVIQEALAVA